MKPAELEMAHKLYEGSSQKTKRKELLKLILQNPTLTDREACHALYQKNSSSSYSHLKRKLIQDLGKVFYMVDHESQATLPKNVSKIYVRRMIQVINHLVTRNAFEAYEDMVKESIQLCDKFELYEEKLLILQILFAKSAYVSKRSRFEEVYQELKNTNKQVDLFIESQRLKDELSLHFTYDTNQSDHGSPEEFYKELKKLHKNSGSARISENYFIGAISYFERKHKFESARKVAEKFREFMEESPTSFAKTHLAGIQMKLSYFYLIAEKKKRALLHAENALALFRKGTYNEWKVLELILQIYFLQGDLPNAEKYLEKFKKHNAYKLRDENKDVYDYHKAILEFKKGRFQDAIFILNKSSDLKKKNTTWYIHNRILDMMCQIEEGNYDIFEFKLNAFRKQFYTAFQKKEDRLSTIFNLLKSIKKHAFDFHLLTNKDSESLAKLSNGKGNFFWDPLEWEIIRFDKWVDEKAQKQHRVAY
ncbi:MAG: hypothetical protein HKN92_02080 [Chitinophagales bacterium]|nr:hypothetical protein [Chitinophagales bacterium]